MPTNPLLHRLPNKGSAIVPAMIVIAVIGIIGVAVLQQSQSFLSKSGAVYKGTQSSTTIDGTLEAAKADLFTQAKNKLINQNNQSISSPSTFFNGVAVSNAALTINFPAGFDGAANPLTTANVGWSYGWTYALDAQSTTDFGKSVRSEGTMTLFVAQKNSFANFKYFTDTMGLPPLTSTASRLAACTNSVPLEGDASYIDLNVGDWEGDTLYGKYHTNGNALSNAHCTGSSTSFWTMTSLKQGGAKAGNTYKDKFTTATDWYVHKTKDNTAGGATTTRAETISAITLTPSYLLPNNASFNRVRLDQGISVSDAYTLPTNANYQENGAINNAISETAPSDSEKRSAFGIGGTGTVPDGLYAPNSGGSVTAGIYVQGCVKNLKLYATAGVNKQNYDITLCDNTLKTITVDYTANTTNVGGTIYTGKPNGVLYVNGQIEKFEGNGTGVGVAKNSEISIVSAGTGDTVVNNAVAYEADPTAAANMAPNPIPKNILGFTNMNGNILFCGTGSACPTASPPYPHLDAYWMAPNGTVAYNWKGNAGTAPKHAGWVMGGGIIGKYLGDVRNSTGTWTGFEWFWNPGDPRYTSPPFFSRYSSSSTVEITEVNRLEITKT